EIGRWLAEMHRHQLPVRVGDVQQRDVAERLEGEQLLLRQPLLRKRAYRSAGENCRCRSRDLQQFAARERHVTVMLSSPTMVLPSSSVQVSTTAPDSAALNLNWMY